MSRKKQVEFVWRDPNPPGAVERTLEKLLVRRLLDGRAELTNSWEDGKIKPEETGGGA